MKYLPTFPERFGSLADARGFMDRFTHAYNHEHHHSGIGLHISADAHYGHASTIAEQRSAALAAARLAHPERFASDTDPNTLALPSPTTRGSTDQQTQPSPRPPDTHWPHSP